MGRDFRSDDTRAYKLKDKMKNLSDTPVSSYIDIATVGKPFFKYMVAIGSKIKHPMLFIEDAPSQGIGLELKIEKESDTITKRYNVKEGHNRLTNVDIENESRVSLTYVDPPDEDITVSGSWVSFIVTIGE